MTQYKTEFFQKTVPRCFNKYAPWKNIYIVKSEFMYATSYSMTLCHGPCSVTFFPKNNHRMALMESSMMATSPLFSATFTTSHPRRNYIGPPLDFIPYSDTTNKPAFLSLPLPTSTMRYSTAAQPEPHHFHVLGQSYHACTSSQGHWSWSPQGLARIWVSILWHPLEYEYFCNMFHSTTICSPNYLLICSCLYLYKYLGCSMYFASSNINLATYLP